MPTTIATTSSLSQRSKRSTPARSSREDTSGISDNETIIDTITARQIAIPASFIHMAERPSERKKKGTKTQIVVSDEASTAMPTSRLPTWAASSASSPSSWRRRKMLSSTTTAGSTNIPTANISPIIETMLRVMVDSKTSRATYMPIKTHRAEVGMARAMTMVERMLRRKRKMIIIAKNAPSSAELTSVPASLSTDSARLRSMKTPSSPLYSSSISCNSATTASPTSMTLAVEALKISSSSASVPLSRS